MLPFIIQTVFLSVVTFVLGWLLGRYIKGLFCKKTDSTGYSSDTQSQSLKTDTSSVDHSDTSDSTAKTAVVTAAAAAASAAVIAKMAADDGGEKQLTIEEVSVDSQDKITEVADVKVEGVVADIDGMVPDINNGVTDNIKAKVDDTVENIDGTVADVTERIEAQVGNAVENISDTATDIEGDITDKVDDVVADIKESAVEVQSDIIEEIDVKADDIVTAIDDVNVQDNTTETVETEVSETVSYIEEAGDKGFDEISNIISGNSEILADGADSSEVVGDKDDSSLLDITKATIIAGTAGIAATVGADTIGQDIAKNVVDTVTNIEADKAEIIADQADELSTKATLDIDNDSVIEDSLEGESAELSDSGSKKQDTDNKAVDEIQSNEENDSDLEVSVDNLEDAVNSMVDSEKATGKSKELDNTLAETVDDLNGDDLINPNGQELIEETNSDDSISNIVKATVATAGAGIAAKVGSDFLDNKSDTDVVSDVIEDVDTTKTLEETLTKKLEDETVEELDETFVEKREEAIEGGEEKLTEKLEEAGDAVSDSVDLNAENDDSDDAIQSNEEKTEQETSSDKVEQLSDDSSLADTAKTAAIVAGAGLAAKVGAEMLDNNANSDDTSMDGQNNKVSVESKPDELGTVHSRRNTRRFRVSRR